MRESTYVTPRTPRQALLNALSEIEASQISDRDAQVDVFLHHVLDYAGGRIFLLMLRRVTWLELRTLCFECTAEVKSEIAEKVAHAMDGKAA